MQAVAERAEAVNGDNVRSVTVSECFARKVVVLG